MSNKHVAQNAIYFSIFCLLFFHCWISVLFFFNKVKAKNYLVNLNENITFPETMLPGVLDIQLVNLNEDCDQSYGMSEMNLTIWPGTIEGVYVGPKVYKSNPCSIRDCTGKEYIHGYFKENCYTHWTDSNVCCDFRIDTPFTYKCRQDVWSSSCICPDNYSKKDDYNFTGTTEREVFVFPAVPSTPLGRFDSKKICSKLITNYTLFDSVCEGGEYCFDYICLKNASSCPDYSSLGNFNPNKAISSLHLSYNNLKCSFLNKADRAYTLEEFHYLSKLSSLDNLGCKFSNVFNYNEDVLLIKQFKSYDHYTQLGLYQQIYDNIDKLTRNRQYDYLNKTIDDIFLSASSHFNINLYLDSCRTPHLFSKLDFSFLTAIDIIDGSMPTIFNYFNGIILFGICGVCIWFFVKLLEKKNNYTGLFRLVVFAQFSFFIFNLIVYFVNQNEDKFEISVKNIQEAKSCFDSNQFTTFLDKLEFGIASYDEIYNTSLTKILIENSILLTMLLIIISPVFNLLKIFGI